MWIGNDPFTRRKGLESKLKSQADTRGLKVGNETGHAEAEVVRAVSRDVRVAVRRPAIRRADVPVRS